MKKGPVTPKGFRDIMPDLAKKRRVFIGQICDTLEEFGFVPLETPTLEFAKTLTGKYGEEEKLIYKFTDPGGRELALRYDLTVPLARFVANNLGLIQAGPFRRYQVGQAFRGEKPQKGRFREFTQVDFDTVGSSDVAEDAKIITAALKSARRAGLQNAVIFVNDRENFKGLTIEEIRIIDKIAKIGRENIDKKLLDFVAKAKPTERLEKIFALLEKEYGLRKSLDFVFDPSLARGLDYYTSTIFELKLNNNPLSLSAGGGGRYDDLIGVFAGRKIPAVGFSFGIDRILDII